MTTRRGQATARWMAGSALALAALLFTTTHGDIGWDGMWMLQVIARVGAGDVLYPDVFCGVPPLAVYLGRGITTLFGVELGALRLLLVAVVVSSYFVSADLLARLTGTRRYDAALAPMMFALALPANVPLYQPLANLLLLCAVDAALRWAGRATQAGGFAAAALFVAGAAAGLSFSAKQTVGAVALVAVSGMVAFVVLGRRRSAIAELLSAWSICGLGFSAGALLILIPVALSGGWGPFLDYAFLNKSTYLRIGRVGYADELWTFVAASGTGRIPDVLGIVKSLPLLLPPLVVACVAAGWRARRGLPAAAAAVTLLAGAELATLFPRADIDHVVPAVPGFLVAMLFAWHLLVATRSGPAGLRPAGTRLRPWFARGRLVRVAAMAIIAAACFARLSASAVALSSSDRAWSSLPHLKHVRIAKRREAELAWQADSLRRAAPGGTLFLLVPNAGLYYLVSGVKNPTPFDYPLATAFGRTGERQLVLALDTGWLRSVCMAPVAGTMAPGQLQRAVLANLEPRAALGPCTLYLHEE